MGIAAVSLSRFRALADAGGVVVFRERLTALGEDVLFGESTTPLRVVVADGDHFRDLAEGGFADEGDIRLKYLAADLPVPPAQGSAATYQGRPYRVRKIRLIPGAIIGEIELRPARR